MAEHTGLEAVHAESGKTFDEIAAERAAETPPPEMESSGPGTSLQKEDL
jgi:hypothetical protein